MPPIQFRRWPVQLRGGVLARCLARLFCRRHLAGPPLEFATGDYVNVMLSTAICCTSNDKDPIDRNANGRVRPFQHLRCKRALGFCFPA